MLATKIEKKRKKMIKFAEIYGMSSEQVLQCSQELDKLIDLYHTQQQNHDHSPTKQTTQESSPLKAAL